MRYGRLKRAAGLVCAAGCVLCGTSAPAQTPGALPRTQAEFEKAINLTPAQKTKAEAIQKKYLPRLQAIEKKYAPEVRKLQQQLVALQRKAFGEAQPIIQQQQKEVDAILTPDQRAKIKQMRDQQMQMMRQQQGQQGQRP